jgi:hypothetical protein
MCYGIAMASPGWWERRRAGKLAGTGTVLIVEESAEWRICNCLKVPEWGRGAPHRPRSVMTKTA